MNRTSPGIESLEKSPRQLGLSKKSRVAVLCHPSSVTPNYRHLADIAEKNFQLTAFFGPQHGIFGETQDNMIEWQDSRDSLGRPIYSLYGERRKPTLESLQDTDALIVDLFDVGSRYYTFIYTLAYCLEVAALTKTKVIILDRPNPLGGQFIEGPILDTAFKSFVGLYPIPVCHGMTVGELALFFASSMEARPEIQIVPLKRWKRSQLFPSTGLPWTLPSPNMPNWEAARLYPGGCLLEATTLSEGRGTTRPFELIGAPFFKWHDIEAHYLKLCKSLKMNPVRFHRQGFIPTFHKYHGEVCFGALQVAPAKNFWPLRHMIVLLRIFRDLYQDQWSWKSPPYEYEYEKLPIDILAGGQKVRHTIDGKLSLERLFESFRDDEESFKKQRKPFLLY